ncbi:MAG: ubiquinol-cytochrome c reductase cytochrome b subunit, partial [Agrococcus casei]
FYAVMWAAASSDLMATHFSLNVFYVIHVLQALLILGPIIGFWLTKRIAIGLQKKDREMVLHGFESGRIVRKPGGEFIEVHQPVDEYERWRLTSFDAYEPTKERPNSAGRITAGTKIRGSLSRWFFEDRITPVTKSELEQSKHDH